MTNFLVTSNLTRPRQIQRGKADVANLWPNEMVVDQNQPGPVQPFKWTEPNNSAHLTFFPVNLWTSTWAKPNSKALFTFWALAFLQSISLSLFDPGLGLSGVHFVQAMALLQSTIVLAVAFSEVKYYFGQ